MTNVQWLIEEGDGSPWKGFSIIRREDANNDVIIAWVPWKRDAFRIAKLLKEDEEKSA